MSEENEIIPMIPLIKIFNRDKFDEDKPVATVWLLLDERPPNVSFYWTGKKEEVCKALKSLPKDTGVINIRNKGEYNGTKEARHKKP